MKEVLLKVLTSNMQSPTSKTMDEREFAMLKRRVNRNDALTPIIYESHYGLRFIEEFMHKVMTSGVYFFSKNIFEGIRGKKKA